jgi:hypothetical protein
VKTSTEEDGDVRVVEPDVVESDLAVVVYAGSPMSSLLLAPVSDRSSTASVSSCSCL